MNRFITKIGMAIVFTALSLPLLAMDQSEMHCKEYHWKAGDIIPIQAQIFKTSDIKLPEEAFDVVWGAKDLWESNYVKNYIFIKPLTTKADGQATTVTVIGKSGNAYEFAVTRVAKLQAHCVSVVTDGALVNEAKWGQSDQDMKNQVANLKEQVSMLSMQNGLNKVEASKEADRKSNEAIRLYQASVNSNYEWNKSSGWFAAAGTVVDSVHDDGRFTYVKLHGDARGLMSIEGDINGKKEILESKYIPETYTYKISGIFPKFQLRAGDSELTVNRKGA